MNTSRKNSLSLGNLTVPQCLFGALLLTLAAVAADQFFARDLYSSSPLWALGICAALVLRRDKSSANLTPFVGSFSLSPGRILVFLVLHASLILLALSSASRSHTVAGTFTSAGWTWAALKLSVLLPTLSLFAPVAWRKILRFYSPEVIAGAVVILTFFPRRTLESLWPWYGPTLGHFVFQVAHFFVPSLAYHAAASPTLVGPQLDVTILFACSGANGIELFDYLFAFIAFLDWDRLAKGRALGAYFAGLAAMLFANALRIAVFVVAGNHGFAEPVSRFHLSAGLFFFAAAFLIYLFAIYHRLLLPTAKPTENSTHPTITSLDVYPSV
jgi:exosortase/archaeosortase family protein